MEEALILILKFQKLIPTVDHYLDLKSMVAGTQRCLYMPSHFVHILPWLPAFALGGTKLP